MTAQKFLYFKRKPGMKGRDFYNKASELSATALAVDGCTEAVVKTVKVLYLKLCY